MPSKLREIIKSVVLVVLFFTTILLLYLIWGNSGSVSMNLSDLIPTTKQEEVYISAKDALLPAEIYYTGGDGAFMRISAIKESYEAYNEAMIKLCNQGSAMITEITKEQYKEATEKYESTQILFGSNVQVPFSEYCSLYGINRTSSFANVSAINAIAFSSAAPDSVLLKDPYSGKYFRLVGEVTDASFKNLNVTGPADITYYDVSAILGEGGGCLFPLQASSALSGTTYKGSYDGSEEIRAEIARSIFRDDFSFVRRMSDNFDNYTFLYGYGQKSLTINASGNVSYKEEVSGGDSAGFMGDLETAVNFAENAVGFKNDSFRYVLGEAFTIGSGRTASHVYNFIQQTNDGFKFFTPGYSLRIQVDGGKVSYFSAESVIPDGNISDLRVEPAANPANAIAAALDKTLDLKLLAENMVFMTPGLFPQHDGTLAPVWCLALHDMGYYYYDLYTGELIQ